MATVSIKNFQPYPEISEKSSPAPLREALHHIFNDIQEGLWLVGGTALAGFYAEHRRSDDLDLFATDPVTHRAAILSLNTLKKEGALFSNERRTPNYYRAELKLKEHSFTADIVLDEHLHKTGNAFKTKSGVWVASLATILAMKLACLISRCSEKDLFDIDWIFSNVGEITAKQIVQIGSLFDGGLTTETLLISLHGTILRKEACHFLLPNSLSTVEQTYKKITTLQNKLIDLLIDFEKKNPYLPEVESLAKAVKDQKKFQK